MIDLESENEGRHTIRGVGISLLLLGVAAAVCLCAIVSWKPNAVQPPASRGYVRTIVKCDECGGDGIVEYPADHPLVKARQYQAGEKCGCPMCGGEGELILEKGHSDE